MYIQAFRLQLSSAAMEPGHLDKTGEGGCLLQLRFLRRRSRSAPTPGMVRSKVDGSGVVAGFGFRSSVEPPGMSIS